MFNSRVSWKYMPATWCLERTGWQASFICMMESPLPTAVVYLQYLSTVLFLTSYVSMDEARLVKDKTEGFCMYVPVHKSHEKSKSSHVSQHVVTSSFLAVSQSSEPIHSCRRSKSLKKQAANILSWLQIRCSSSNLTYMVFLKLYIHRQYMLIGSYAFIFPWDLFIIRKITTYPLSI